MDENYTFETVEHDILHIKDYFHNYKFSYIERATRQNFYEKLKEKNFTENNIIEILNRSKSQLVEVKKISKMAGDIIKEYSLKIFDLENEIKKNKEILDNQAKALNLLESKIKSLDEISKDLLKKNSLSMELKNYGQELQELIKGIETKKQALSKINNKCLEEELDALKSKKESLLDQERKWAKLAMESNVEDLYCWYNKTTELIQKIFQYKIKGYRVEDHKTIIKFELNELEIDVFIKNGKFVDAKILSGIEIPEFNKIKEYSIKINDARFLLVIFLFFIENHNHVSR